MTWCRAGLVALGLALLALGAASASAEDPPQHAPINVDVMVSRISNQGSEVDSRAARLDEKLRSQFRYGSMEVLERHRMVLALDELGTVKLPTGHNLRVRPLEVNEHGVLMAVEVDDTLKTDMRIPSGNLVVIGAERYEDGKIVISIEPHY